MNVGSIIPLVVNSQPFNLFLFNPPQPIPLENISLHNHHYAEIHLILAGSALFSVGMQQHVVLAGQAIIIPSGQFHSSTALQSNTTEYTFALTSDITGCRKTTYSKAIVNEILQSMATCKQQDHISAMIPWFFRLVTDLVFAEHFQKFERISYPHLIHEYLNWHYNKAPSLQKLAKHLGISVKQTQRIIKKEKGHTFSEEVVARRMSIADYLLRHSTMNNEEIATFVGYQTYAGFWKARKRHIKEQSTSPK